MTDEDFPVLGLHRGQPVPLLREIPQVRWRELLAPLTDGARRQAAQSAPHGQHGDALVLIAELELEDLEREQALRDAVDEPSRLIAPTARKPRSLTGRQVNVRLRWRDFESLEEAADIAAAPPPSWLASSSSTELSACCTSTAVSTAQAGARARHPTTTPRSENITSR